MSRVSHAKTTIVIGVAVFILLLMQITSFAGAEWERLTQLPTEREGFATAVVENKVYLIGGTLFKNVKRDKAILGPYGISTVEMYNTQTRHVAASCRYANAPHECESCGC